MWMRAPLSSWASCSPSAGSSLRWDRLASSRILVRTRIHVLVVVEYLVVIAPGVGVPFCENGARSVDHYFPHIGVFEEWFKRAISG